MISYLQPVPVTSRVNKLTESITWPDFSSRSSEIAQCEPSIVADELSPIQNNRLIRKYNTDTDRSCECQSPSCLPTNYITQGLSHGTECLRVLCRVPFLITLSVRNAILSYHLSVTTNL